MANAEAHEAQYVQIAQSVLVGAAAEHDRAELPHDSITTLMPSLSVADEVPEDIQTPGLDSTAGETSHRRPDAADPSKVGAKHTPTPAAAAGRGGDGGGGGVAAPTTLGAVRHAALQERCRQALGDLFPPVYEYLSGARASMTEEKDVRRALLSIVGKERVNDCMCVDELIFIESMT